MNRQDAEDAKKAERECDQLAINNGASTCRCRVRRCTDRSSVGYTAFPWCRPRSFGSRRRRAAHTRRTRYGTDPHAGSRAMLHTQHPKRARIGGRRACTQRRAGSLPRPCRPSRSRRCSSPEAEYTDPIRGTTRCTKARRSRPVRRARRSPSSKGLARAPAIVRPELRRAWPMARWRGCSLPLKRPHLPEGHRPRSLPIRKTT